MWPQPSRLFLSLTELASGAYLETAPISLAFHHEAFDLAGQIGVNTSAIKLSANGSIGAQLTSERHGGALVRTLDNFVPASRPVFSKLVKMRG